MLLTSYQRQNKLLSTTVLTRFASRGKISVIVSQRKVHENLILPTNTLSLVEIVCPLAL